jgi:hypothetical protein
MGVNIVNPDFSPALFIHIFNEYFNSAENKGFGE